MPPPPFQEQFLAGIKKLTILPRKYKVIEDDEDLNDLLLGTDILDYVDLSALDLRPHADKLLSEPTGPFAVSGIKGWTDNVIWPTPDKLPAGFNPTEILSKSKSTPEIVKLRQSGKTGDGVNIAIIDHILDFRHPEISGRIESVHAPVYKMKNTNPHFHASMVTGCAAGTETGVAPNASIHFFTCAKADENRATELKTVLTNIKTYITEHFFDKRIRILSFSGTPMGASLEPSDELHIIELLKEIESMGVKIIICGDTYRKRTQYPESFSIAKHDFIPCTYDGPVIGDGRINYTTDVIGIPTNKRTTPGVSGFIYKKINGDSAAAPYLAGVFACALQGNEIFYTRPNWQSELNDIMQQTATEHPHGGKIINPTGIVERVSEIARSMEIDLIKQQATQNA